jgi:site-specific DNA-adenine methylase
MGTGNILLNIDVTANKYIGSDKQKLLPHIYSILKNQVFTRNDIEKICDNFEQFSTKESYYTFRSYWNEKYLSDNFDKSFCLETALLLKMCSNSMVRFNPNTGCFNQGFRGFGEKKKFFTDVMKNLIIDNINKLSCAIPKRNYVFTNTDFLEYKDNNTTDRILIIDPPYTFPQNMYDTGFTTKNDNGLLDLLNSTKNNFIYFNYLSRDGIDNVELKKLLDNRKDLKIIDINSQAQAGQGRKKNIKEVREIIVTNVL